jgi:hypothetical protein
MLYYIVRRAVAGARRPDLISAALYRVSIAIAPHALISAAPVALNKSHEIHFRCA